MAPLWRAKSYIMDSQQVSLSEVRKMRLVTIPIYLLVGLFIISFYNLAEIAKWTPCIQIDKLRCKTSEFIESNYIIFYELQ
jgi:hypothetical protein